MSNDGNKEAEEMQNEATVKVDTYGNLISGVTALKHLYLKTYVSRLEHRKIDERYSEIRKLKEELWSLRYDQLKNFPGKQWTVTEVISATKKLKNNKSRDPNGLISEVFKPGIAGKSLQIALVDLMNLILSTFINLGNS